MSNPLTDSTSFDMSDTEKSRMTITQLTYGISISILAVINMLIVWTIVYVMRYYEKQGGMWNKRLVRFRRRLDS